MKSFPSTLNKGGYKQTSTTVNSSIKDVLVNSFKEAAREGIANATSGNNFDTQGIRYNEEQDKKVLLNHQDFTAHKDIAMFHKPIYKTNPGGAAVENQFNFDSRTIDLMNKYRTIYGAMGIDTVYNRVYEDKNKKKYLNRTTQVLAGSLFNPYYGIAVTGAEQDVPLLNNTGTATDADGQEMYEDLSDCSIKNLVALSQRNNSGIAARQQNPLGNARYKYADFMYCKELGQISNNHLITLRRFAYPVGDNIFSEATAHHGYNGAVNNWEMGGDIGRMVTWFGTEENKLEDIIKMSWKQGFTQMESKWDQQESKEGKGWLGALSVLSSPDAVKMAIDGTLPSLEKIPFLNNGGYDGTDKLNLLGANYDKHKIYEPLNTIRKTDMYNGELEFSQEFTITFNYKLRGYDNINPKSAFLDLIGNILATTYQRGEFWGGRNEILGIQPNADLYTKADALMKGGTKKLSSMLQSLIGDPSGAIDQVMGWISENGTNAKEALEEKYEEAKSRGAAAYSSTEGAVNKVKAVGGAIKDTVVETIKDSAGLTKISNFLNTLQQQFTGGGGLSGLSQVAMISVIKTVLGRPALYWFDSLLYGAPVGFWHLTIGNPLNPIVSMGNLKITNVVFSQSGPLGVDDFPTEIKVAVSLAHCRTRDSVDIEKMYTRGRRSIYFGLSQNEMSEVYNTSALNNQFYNAIYRKDRLTDDSIGYMGDFSIDRIQVNRKQIR